MGNIRIIIAVLMVSFCSSASYGQTELKINGAYALVGVINPSVEIPLSQRISYNAEVLYSPWQSVKLGGHSRPEHFLQIINTARFYFKKHEGGALRGWWGGVDIGALLMIKVSRPYILNDGKIFRWNNSYQRGMGILSGVSIGYKWNFGKRITLDVFAGGTFVTGWYNAYTLYDEFDSEGNQIAWKDKIEMNPQRPNQPEHPDPWNGSSHWIPRFGVMVGYKFL